MIEYWYDAMAMVPSIHVIRTVLPTTAEEQVGGVTTNEAKKGHNGLHESSPYMYRPHIKGITTSYHNYKREALTQLHHTESTRQPTWLYRDMHLQVCSDVGRINLHFGLDM